MSLDFYEVEAAFADPFLLEMDWLAVPKTLVLQLGMGEFDHFAPLWRFLREQGAENIDYFSDFLILPSHIIAARQQMNWLWPEIHRTRQFFHVDDDPFWQVRDLFGRLTENGGGLLALCD